MAFLPCPKKQPLLLRHLFKAPDFISKDFRGSIHAYNNCLARGCVKADWIFGYIVVLATSPSIQLWQFKDGCITISVLWYHLQIIHLSFCLSTFTALTTSQKAMHEKLGSSTWILNLSNSPQQCCMNATIMCSRFHHYEPGCAGKRSKHISHDHSQKPSSSKRRALQIQWSESIRNSCHHHKCGRCYSWKAWPSH